MMSSDSCIPAASVILLRADETGGYEVLLLKRNETVPFAANHWVFPGGKIESVDYQSEDDLEAAVCAAVRECSEEAGIDLDVSQLAYFSTWTAPSQAKKRFITHFFVAEVDFGQSVSVDGWEIVEGVWLPLSEVVKRGASGRYQMMPPTIVSLFDLNQHNTVNDMATFLYKRPYFDYAPKIFRNDEGFWAVYPGDSAWQTGDLNDQDGMHRLHQDNRDQYIFYRGKDILQ